MSQANESCRTGSWLSVKLGEVVTLVNGRAYKQPEMLDAGTPILRIQNLNGGSRWFYSTISLSPEKYCESGDLLYAWSATFGPYLYQGPRAIFHYHIWNVRPTLAIDKRFAYYELLRVTDRIKKSAHGVAMPHVTKAGMESWPIELPPLSEQKRIADKLDTVLTRVDAVNASLARVAPLLKRFRQSVLAAATSGRLTEEWRSSHNLPESKITTLGELIKVSSGDGLTAKEMHSDGGIPVYGGNGVNGYHSEANVSEPTIVVGRVGYYCGSVHLTPSSAWITDNALRVKFSSAILKREFLYYALMGTNLRENMSSTAQPVISGQKIYPLEFRLPVLNEQSEIVRRVETLFAFADRLEARLKAAQTATERLTPSLLAKAFRGELVLQDPSDEPASELLKRLTATAPASPKRRGRVAKAV